MKLRKLRVSRSVFTLIELLLVITILMILMGMMLPTLSRAKGKGKQASCMSKMKQMAIAFQYYSTDYDGFMVHDRAGIPQASQYWTQQLRQELGDPAADMTTGSSFFKDPGVSGAFDYPLSSPEASHYMYNDQIGDDDGGGVSGIRVVKADETSKTILVFDGSNSVRIGGVAQLLANTLLFPHPADKSNVLFLDSHTNVFLDREVPVDSNDIFWNPNPL